AEAVAVGGDEDRAAGEEVGDDRVEPVRELADDYVLEALRLRAQLRREGRVARVRELGVLGVVVERGRRGVVAAALEHVLLLPVLREGCRLVLALEGVVVTIVHAPTAADRDLQAVGGLQRELRGADRALLEGGVDYVGQQTGVLEQLAAARRLLLAL